MNSVSIRDLVMTRSGYPAVANSTFDLPKQHLTLLTGDNGSGKTTLLQGICGLLEPARGSIDIPGEQNVQGDSRKLRKYFAYVGHEPLYMRHIKVIDHLKLCQQLDASKPNHFAVEIEEGLQRFGLQKRENIEVTKLSAGQLRRLHLLSSLVRSTPTLCLDEPHASLDSKSKDLIDDVIFEQYEKGRSFIIATHDPDRIYKNATHLLNIDSGCTNLEVLS